MNVSRSYPPLAGIFLSGGGGDGRFWSTNPLEIALDASNLTFLQAPLAASGNFLDRFGPDNGIMPGSRCGAASSGCR